nr:unnamed protein product [Digitaria exilis]
MASSSKLLALFLAFAVAAAALQPSEAARVVQSHQRCNCNPPVAPGSHEPEKVALQADAGGVPSQTTTPPAGVPTGAGQLPPGLLPAILGLLFPPLGGIIGLLQPLIPAPGSTTPPQQQQQQPTECMTPLQSMAACTGYLTNLTVAAPPSECCDGVRAVVRDAPICLCHGINGGMSQFLPSPVDPLRMAVLPLACGTVLPIQTLLMCNSQQVPPIMPPAPATPATPPPVSP